MDSNATEDTVTSECGGRHARCAIGDDNQAKHTVKQAFRVLYAAHMKRVQ